MNEYFLTVQVYVGDLTKFHMLNVYVEMARMTIDNINAFRKDIGVKYDVPWENVIIINLVKLERRTMPNQKNLVQGGVKVNGPV